MIRSLQAAIYKFLFVITYVYPFDCGSLPSCTSFRTSMRQASCLSGFLDLCNCLPASFNELVIAAGIWSPDKLVEDILIHRGFKQGVQHHANEITYIIGQLQKQQKYQANKLYITGHRYAWQLLHQCNQCWPASNS